MKAGNFIRQGDVKIKKISSFPAGKRTPVMDRILARGEMTGHAHRVAAGEAEVFTVGKKLFLSVREEGISIVHEEHRSVLVPPGKYEVARDREYDYIQHLARQTED